MAHSWSSGGTGRRVVVINGAQIGVQWAMRERETYNSNLIKSDAYFFVRALKRSLHPTVRTITVKTNDGSNVFDLYFLMSKRNANSKDNASKWKWEHVTSNIPIVCFGIKKCMFSTEKSIAPYSDPFHAYRFSLLEKKAISGLVAGDANGRRTPNMPVNKKLQIVPFQKMIEGTSAATLDLIIMC